ELLEGVICCDQCHAEYPVVAGVLILAADPRSYVGRHYSSLLTSAAAEGVLGPPMMQYLQSNGYDFLEPIRPDDTYGSISHQTMYLCAHYDHPDGSEAPPWKPFANFFDREYENFYDLLARKVERFLDRDRIALDLGCNVGGMTYRLASHCGRV